MPLKAWVFDAYGTLFDVHSAVRRYAAQVGAEADALSRLWRFKQLEYTWTSSLSRRHRDFWECTSAALDFALSTYGVSSAALREALLRAYLDLEAYPDVRPTLQKLKDSGKRVAVLSNGTPQMLASAVQSAGLGDVVDACLSVEDVGIYKPDASVYRLAVERLGTAAPEISFQSSNAWDVAGARTFGLRAVWVNRTGQPNEYGLRGTTPEVRSLGEIRALA